MIKRDLYYERIPTKSLREDVRILGNILGNVIKKQEGQTFIILLKKLENFQKQIEPILNKKTHIKKFLKN